MNHTDAEAQVARMGWRRDAWGIYVHRDDPDGDGYETAEEVLASTARK